MTSVLQCHSFLRLGCSCDADETVCGHVCVEVHADMLMSVLFITCRCVVSTLAVDVGHICWNHRQIWNDLSILKIAREENQITSSYLSIWSFKRIKRHYYIWRNLLLLIGCLKMIEVFLCVDVNLEAYHIHYWKNGLVLAVRKCVLSLTAAVYLCGVCSSPGKRSKM